MKFFCLLIILIFISFINAAKILGLYPLPSKSHSILGQALFTELAKRGHDVTFLSPYPFKKEPPKNYRDIAITNEDFIHSFDEEFEAAFEATDASPILMLKFWIENMAFASESLMKDENVQKLLNSEEKFDLCVIEFLMNESILGFGAQFECKIVGMSTLGQVKYVNDMMHAPMPLSTVTHPFLSFTDRMTFAQRMENVLTTALEDFMFYVYHYPLQAQIYDKYFREDKPSFKHMLRHSVSLVLLNTHFSLNYPQAYLPNMIEIGGFHVKSSTNPLPDDIKKFIEGAKEGVVYFSLGGNVLPSKMELEKKKDILNSLKKLKQRIILKWDEQVEVDKEKFLVGTWFPQDDILAHPNVILFVTHGGLLSCTESIVREKPIVGIPVFGDQMMNMARAELLGWGLQVTYKNLSEASFSWALNEVLQNPFYKQNVQKIANRLKDQPQTPMEKAIFYIEYVIRHEGAYFMQSSSQYMNLIEYNNLDVYGTLASFVLIAIFIVTFIMWKIFKLFYSKPSVKKQKKT